jgi:2'-5' RNA ligase
VARWRERFDSSAAQGMPAHVTALFPFLPIDRLTDPVLIALREICGGVPVLDVEFRRMASFPGVLFLDPEPADGLRELTAALARRWPEAPPYGGAFADVTPHLTVAHGVGDDVLADVERALRHGLPISARLSEACLYLFDGTRWRLRQRLPVAADTTA